MTAVIKNELGTITMNEELIASIAAVSYTHLTLPTKLEV